MATLYPHAGQPLPQWPLKITINTLLSIYNVVFKTLLAFVVASCIGQLQWTWFSSRRSLHDVVLYNQAAQGAWGSARLLLSHHIENPLAALGCIILILSVALDPFTQQLARPKDCEVIEPSQARLPRANVFSDTSEDDTFGQDIDDTMKRGILGSNNGLWVNCPTGNCTFSETFGTVGYCSYCEDSSDQLTFNTSCSATDGLVSNETASEIIPATPDDCPTNTTFNLISSLPEEWYLESYYRNPPGPVSLNVTYSLGADWFYGRNGVEVAAMDIMYNDTENTHPEQMMVQVIAGKTTSSDEHRDLATGKKKTDCSSINPPDNWRCGQTGAATCSLSPCVRLYNATVSNGQLTERLVDQSGSVFWGSTDGNSGLAILDTECVTNQEKTDLQNQGVVFNSTGRWLPLNARPEWTSLSDSFTTAMNLTERLFHRQCLYYMGTGFVKSMAPFVIGSYFTGTLAGVGGKGGGIDSFAISQFKGDYIIDGLYNSGRVDMASIEGAMANISESLTQYLRTHGDGNYSADALGQVRHYATCIEVQWEWLALPGLLALLTLVLLLFVIITADVSRQPIWKGSPLVWILRGYNEERVDGGRWNNETVNTLVEMEDRSKKTIVSIT
ncbi:hypothetical protein PFICI_01624 [Pestalotiopsis fici W106-1]|uniref:Uncharacterized protein n=1 Tax=Pestalotiopsis fici (strain W106-1 / CGMCC3.15140) TaxID=1229662 RepID=W3XRG2_PESFW|nr:uncharacterized protein PFICI_01624 [Pestalotiopsis fici W106-1]ETS87796.1 hypothetical protein PFICI_01624 [Pestalotiopsis fici W106-1]